MAIFSRGSTPPPPGRGTGEAFERGLRDDLPRGLKGREDHLPRTEWAEAQGLGDDWEFPHKKNAGLLLGYRKGREVGWSDDRHALTVAGTRAGKGISFIVPNLLLYPGSVLCIDPKGELARVTGRRRAEVGKCVVLDPFGENGRHPSGHYNPLDELDPEKSEAIDQAGAIADALIIHHGDSDPHWSQAARGLLRGLILLTLGLPEDERNLVTVRELLMLTHKDLAAHRDALNRGRPRDEEGNIRPGQEVSGSTALAHMMIGAGDVFENVVRGAGEALRDMHEKERESVLSETRVQTQFLDSPALRKILKRSDFSLKDFARGVTSVFLCLPARHMDTHDRWLRVITNLAVGAFEPRRDPQGEAEKGRVPILMLLEEFPVLKKMEKLEAAAGQLAGSGVKMWVIVQDFGQLKKYYGDGWETFVANAGVLVAFGNNDVFTLGYLTQKLGKRGMLISKPSGASASELLRGGGLEKEDLKEASLLEIDEVSTNLAREKRRALVLAAGQKPLILERIFYFDDDRFKGMYDD